MKKRARHCQALFLCSIRFSQIHINQVTDHKCTAYSCSEEGEILLDERHRFFPERNNDRRFKEKSRPPADRRPDQKGWDCHTGNSRKDSENFIRNRCKAGNHDGHCAILLKVSFDKDDFFLFYKIINEKIYIMVRKSLIL